MATIVLKQIGQNLILTIDGQEYTKKIADKDERETLKATIKEVQSKSTKGNMGKLVKIFTEKATQKAKEAEEIKVVEKSVSKKIKKESKKHQVDEPVAIPEQPIEELVNNEEAQIKMDKLQQENEQLKKQVAQRPAPYVAPARKGEY